MRRLVYVLVSSLLACGGGHDPANPAKGDTTHAGARDAGQRAVVEAAPPVAAANAVCETLATCSDGGAYVSMRECVKQMSERFTNETSAECYDCIGEITCAGWQAIANGDVNQCDVCSGCCKKVDDACAAGTSSVPNSANDPCPQNDPTCPASMYNALARCGLDGKWQKGPDGAISCACLPKGGDSNPPPTATSSCGNGRIEGAEQCEGSNLQGMTCNTLAPGSSGVLGCSRVTCRYDTTMCIAGPVTGADAGA